MKLQKRFAFLTVFILLTGLVFLGGPLNYGPQVQAQIDDPELDIDDFEGQELIDREFFFGGKDEIKRDVINKANETNREEIQIKRDEELNPSTTTTTTTTTTTSTDTNASFNGTCEVNSSSGTATATINGNSLCTVTGASPVQSAGTANFTCTPGATVTISGTCTALNCRLFATSFSGLTCAFGTSAFVTGGFNGATGFATSASTTCTCQ